MGTNCRKEGPVKVQYLTWHAAPRRPVYGVPLPHALRAKCTGSVVTPARYYSNTMRDMYVAQLFSCRHFGLLACTQQLRPCHVLARKEAYLFFWCNEGRARKANLYTCPVLADALDPFLSASHK